MKKDRDQLKRELKQNYFTSLSELQTRRERTLMEKNGELEKLDNEIEMVKLNMEILEKLP